ncbi:MAG: TonB-dependent receptor [Cytophagaceae bacterium SCN 52-12]|nr:MAG: TonB-dependent receptor [Cytophagaceae bacterium SCN 52-12]
MKKRLLISSVCYGLLICSCTGVAAQHTYEWRGIVVDSITQEPLIGAALFISGHYDGVHTNVDGKFVISRIPPGKTRITVTYLGYVTKVLEAAMPSDAGNDVTIRLSPSAVQLEGVTVTGSFEGQSRALNQQKAADNIKNIISADLIGKFPDLNVAEALQRVPGINISRDKGEGSSVSVRGTPVHFTNISINGEQMPSVQESGQRTEALDLVPADQLGSMEVTKALTPDMDGDAIGGNINLKTPTARSLKKQVRGEAGLGFNNLSGGLNGIGRLRYSQRFLSNDQNRQGRIGVMISGSYFATDNSEDRIDVRWSGLERPVTGLDKSDIVQLGYDFRKTENQRTRVGVTATLDYKVRNHEIIFNYMYNYRNDDDIRNRLRYDFDRSGSVWVMYDSLNNGRIRRDINLWNETKTNQSFNLQGTHTSGSWTVDWGAFYTISNRTLTSTRGDFARDNITIIAENSNGMLAEVPQYKPAVPGFDRNNPLLLNDFRRYEEDLSVTDADNMVAKLNINKTYMLGANKGSFKFGGKLRRQTNEKLRDNRVLSFFDPNRVVNLTEAFARVATRTEPVSYLNGRYALGPRVDKARFTDYIATYRPLLTEAADSWDAERLSKSDSYEASEGVYAAYLMNRIQLKKVLLLAGLRYEFNKVTYDAFDVHRSGTTVVAEPITGGNNYGFLLPSLHVKYGLTDMMNIRFAYTQSYARPNFVDIVPFVNFDADAVTLFIGNTELQPSLSHNLDLMFEQYSADGGIISGGLFYKNMDHFQFTRVVPSLPEDYPGFPNTMGFRFRQEQNGEAATVYGLEVNMMHRHKNLPGVLSGLSSYFNYTFTQSNASTQDRTGIRLPGQALHSGNASLSFDHKGFTSKVSLNYNGSFINSVASSRQDDIIQDDRFQLDANFSQQITKRISAYAEFVNITNSPARMYQGEKHKVSRLAYFGWWTRFGVSFRL